MRTLIILLLGAATVYASTLCFDIPTNQLPRVTEAFGSLYNLKDASGSPRPATQAEVQQAMVAYTQQTTQDYERRKNMAQFQPSPVVSPTSTPTSTP